LAASPVLLLTALLIRLESRGPVIYRSKRAGRDCREFDFLKFRSMYPDADRRLKELQHLNQYKNAGDGVTFMKLKNDPRITRVGRFIRKFSIDELPQLINIIRGDMSLVGNRPLPLYEAKQLTQDDFAERFLAPAGLTGLWQVTKRGKDDMSVKERMNLDITYAKKYSLAMDLKIFFKTFGAFIQKENV
jgi:lipopolysaccharide/colanic/teichoic acid biosynthesis glycosyltransferase